MVQLCFTLRHRYHMTSPSYCFQRKEQLFIPSESDCTRRYSRMQKTCSGDSSPFFMHPVQRPSLGHERSSSTKYRSTHTSSSSWRHMVLLRKDSLEMCSAQKNTYANFSASIHTAATKLIGDDRHKCLHSPEKVAPWSSPPAIYHPCATLHTLLLLELRQLGWGKVRSTHSPLLPRFALSSCTALKWSPTWPQKEEPPRYPRPSAGYYRPARSPAAIHLSSGKSKVSPKFAG